MANIANLVGQVNAANASIDSAKQGQLDVISILDDARVKMDQYLTQGPINQQGDSVLSFETRKLAELRAEEKKQDLANSINYSDLSQNLLTLQAQSAVQAVQAAQVVQQKESVGLFDNPIEFILNQLTLGDDYARLEAAKQTNDMVTTRLGQINQTMDSTAKITDTFTQKLTKESIDSQVMAVQNAVKADALKADITLLTQKGNSLKELVALDESKVRNIGAILSAQNSAESLAMQRESHKISMAQAELQLEKWQNDKNAQEMYAKSVVIGLTALGQPIDAFVGPDGKINQAKITALRDGELKEYLNRAAMIGMTARVEKGPTGEKFSVNLGSDPVEVLDTYNKLNVKPSESQLKTLQVANDSVSQAITQLGTNGKITPQVRSEATKLFKARMESSLAVINPLDKTNPYSPPSLDVLEKLPAVTNTQWWKAVVAPRKAAGNYTDFDPSVLMSDTVAAIKAGTIKLEQAADGITLAATLAAETNNRMNRYDAIGAPVQTTFNVKLQSTPTVAKALNEKLGAFDSSTWARTVKVNLMDPTQVSHYLATAKFGVGERSFGKGSSFLFN